MTGRRFLSEHSGQMSLEGMADPITEPELPEGFRYTADVLSTVEERGFVRRLERLPFQPFEFHGHSANRRIYTFGHKYVFAGQRYRADAGIPDFFQPLIEIAACISGKLATAFQQVMVTEYAPGAGIGWHLDRPSYEEIVGISFLASCALRFRRRADERWVRRTAHVEPRSAYLLDGAARTNWQHSIAPMDVLRYSVTLRTFRPGHEPTDSSDKIR
jgi:alkylated DNA repair dioxygenase AlkB